MVITLKVLLLTSKATLPPSTNLIGDSPFNPRGDKEVVDYIELLTASNIPFDLKYIDNFVFNDCIEKDKIKYSTIIFTEPETLLSAEQIDLFQKLSHHYGISIIASYNKIGPLTKSFFGIEKVIGKKICFPCLIDVNTSDFSDKNIAPGIKLGNGFQISWQKWGLKRHPIRYFKKHIKKFLQQVFVYQKVISVDESKIHATIKNSSDPVIQSYQYGRAVNYYIALQSDTYLDRFNSLHRIVREIIRKNSGWGMVECNLADTMVLRMDDPGTCERIYLDGYNTEILDKKVWDEIFKLLQTIKAKLSVMYVPLWVDDANINNGRLFIGDKEVQNRKPGAIYHSKDVIFYKNTNKGKHTYNYKTEFAALQSGAQNGWLDIESHGLTHVDPDITSWSKAQDRYSNFNWYHEFRHVPLNKDVIEPEQQKIVQQSAEEIYSSFGVWPSSLTPSGHEQSENSEQIALDRGFKLFSSEYNTFKKGSQAIRNGKIQSVFLENTNPEYSFSAAGYPVVGIFHDYEVAKMGVVWLNEKIQEWQNVGVKKIIPLRELCGYLCSEIEAHTTDDFLSLSIDISNTGDFADTPGSQYFSKHQMDIDITIPKKKTVKTVSIGDTHWQNYHYSKSFGLLKVSLPPFNNKTRQEVTVSFS